MEAALIPAGEWLREKAIAAIPRVPPYIVRDLLETDSMRLIVKDGPNWLKSAYEFLHVDKFFDQLVNADLNAPDLNDVFSIQFLPITANQSMLSIQEMPAPSSEWLGLIAGATFASSPSVETFLNAIGTLADNRNAELERWLIYKLPWPLASALAFLDDVGLEEIRRLLQTGEFGDADGWSQAEERWIERGFGIDDILYTGSQLPFDRNVPVVGFPFSTSVTATLTDNLPTVIPVLLCVYDRLDESALKPWIANWLLFVLSSIRRNEVASKLNCELSVELFRRLITDAVRVKDSVFLDGLDLLDYGTALSDGEIEFFDWLGGLQVELVVSVSKKGCLPSLLANSVRANTGRLGLLRAFTLWMTEETASTVPDLHLTVDNDLPLLFREALVSLRILQGRWVEAEVAVLAQCVAEFLRSDLISSLLLGDTSPRIMSRAVFIELLIHIRRHATPACWREEARIVRRLNDSIRRRTTDLSSSEVWLNLGLPTGLLPVLPQQ